MKFMKETADRKFNKSAAILNKRKYREMIFYFALLVTPKQRELRRKILAQIEHVVHRAKNLLALLKALARYRTKIKRKYRKARRGKFCFANETGLSFALVKRSKIQRCIAMQDAALSELGKVPGS